MSTTDHTRPADQTRSIGGLLGDAFRQGSALLKTEMLLARSEISENVSRGLAGLVFLIFGAVFLIGSLNVLLVACVTALVDAGLSGPIASLIVAAATAILGFVLVRVGMNRMKVSALVPDRTAEQLRQDAALVQETTR